MFCFNWLTDNSQLLFRPAILGIARILISQEPFQKGGGDVANEVGRAETGPGPHNVQGAAVETQQ
jgi:hypothetical protein